MVGRKHSEVKSDDITENMGGTLEEEILDTQDLKIVRIKIMCFMICLYQVQLRALHGNF